MPNQELDQDVINLAKAIRQKESGGNPNARGASGEFGFYQFMPDTWKAGAQKFLGNAAAPLTPENQNKVAYSQIKEWKDQGYNPGQIASLWNSGKPDPTGNVGVNSQGVKYDTPSYVRGVYSEYQKLKGAQAPAIPQNSGFGLIPTAHAAEETPAMHPQETTVDKWGRRLDTVFGGGKIGEFIGTKIAEARATPEQKAAVAEFGSDTFEGPTKKELAGDVGRVALNFAPVGTASGALATRLAAEGVKRARPIANIATGAGTGYAFDAAESARQGGSALPEPGVGTLIGGALPLVAPVARGIGNIAAKSTKFGVSQATGLNPDTISQIVQTPQAFTKQARSTVSRESLGKSVLSDIRSKQREVSAAGKLYEPLRSAPGFVSVPRETISAILDKYGVKLVKGKLKMGPESRPISKTDAKQIEDFVKQYGSTLKLSPNAYFNAKQKLSELSKYNKLAPEGRTPEGTRLARDLRAAYEQIGDRQIPGLEKLDEAYAPLRRDLNALRKDYLDKDGNLKDSALNKIANLTGKGKDQVLRRLEQIRPNIRQEISILKAIEDIEHASGNKVGTYTRGGIAAGSAVMGNVPLAITAILAQPALAVPIIRQYGLAASQVKQLTQGLRGFLQQQTAQGLTPGDRLLNTRLMNQTKLPDTPLNVTR